MLRRDFIAITSLFATSPVLFARSSEAKDGEAWPSKPVQIIVPFSTGGAADNMGRRIAKGLSEGIKQRFVVSNVTGAGGNIGAAEVARAPNDGYTLLLGTIGTHSINPLLYPNIPYDPKADFTPISLLGRSANLIIVNASSPLNSIQDLVDALNENPGKLSYASGGTGTSQHLAGELFKSRTNTNMLHVPYRGGPAALNDLLGGRVDLGIDNFATAWPLVKGGQLKALAITSSERWEDAPDIPTVAETLPNFEALSWHALFAPANLSDVITQKLANEVHEVMQEPKLRDSLTGLGITSVGSTSEELASFIDSETTKWSKVIKDANITIE